jgi:drug/metabolite transporter (DMT)-like permease
MAPSWPGAGWLVLLALSSQVVGWLLISTSLPRLPAALTSVLLTMQPVGSVALAALIFGESPTGLQLLGVGLVLAALLAAGRSGRALEVAGPEASPADQRAPAAATALEPSH